MTTRSLPSFARREWFLGFSVSTCLIFLFAGGPLLRELSNPLRLGLAFVWLFAAILGSALAVARHADRLAERLGEPYGTLILTLSATSIEVVSISAVMLHGQNNPTLARDTLFAVTMIVLNGMVGFSLLMGGWRWREQQYNLHGANAYLGVIIPLGVLSLVMPGFTMNTAGLELSFSQEIFLVLSAVSLYIAFLVLQTHRHREYFSSGKEAAGIASKSAVPVLRHVILLGAYMVPVVVLAQKLAEPVDYMVETLRVPAALAGATMAVLVAAPEAIGAVRAAAANHLQRSINIFLGSVLSTIGLTIPAILVISHLTHHRIVLGLQHSDLVLFLLTLMLCVVTFSSGRTNVLQGAVHLVLFAAYLFLIFQG